MPTEQDLAVDQQSSARQAAVAAVVWRWQAPGRAGSGNKPGIGQSLLALSIGVAVGGVLWKLGHVKMASVVLTLATLIFVSSLVAPSLHRLFLGGAAILGVVAGRVITYLLLVPLFVLFFALFGRLFRRGRNDRMQRWLDPALGTYWTTRTDRPRTLAFYERQF